MRIAQELHDVVADNVSLIVIQAQALGATVVDPRVTAATDGIAELGREAMAEMHRTLKLLRAVPHRAGSAHERRQARGSRANARPDRHAGARRAVRRHAQRWTV